MLEQGLSYTFSPRQGGIIITGAMTHDPPQTSRLLPFLRDVLIYVAIAAACVLVWGAWRGWRTPDQFSDGFFYAALACAAIYLLSGANMDSSTAGRALLRREPTPGMLAERIRRSQEKLSLNSFSTRIMLAAILCFLISLILAL